MDRQQVRIALLKITACVLLGTTWVFWSFVYATRPEQAPSANPLEALMRLPASLPEQLQPTTKVLPPIDMHVLPVNCWDVKDSAARETGSRWVRLTGKACQIEGNSENVSVRNISNGYTATVFAASGAMTTDFIPLQMGRNEILVRFETSRGVSVESQFVLSRQ